jgi:hypothetical protein
MKYFPLVVDGSCTWPRLAGDGQGRVLVALTVGELEELAFATSDPAVRLRLAAAIGLLDVDRAGAVLDHHRAMISLASGGSK